MSVDSGLLYCFSKNLYVDSKDRVSTGSISDFVIPYKREYNGYSYWSPYALKMTYSIMTVNNNNNIITLAGTNYTIANGYYATIAAFLVAVNAAITGAGYTAALNATTQKITISAAGVFTMASTSPSPAILYQLGFNPFGTYSGANTYTGTSPGSLLYTRYIDFGSHYLMKYCEHSDTSAQKTPGHIFCRGFVNSNLSVVPDIGLQGNTNYNGTQLPKYMWLESENIGQPSFQLYDEWGLSPLQETDYTIEIAFFKSKMKMEDKF